VGLDKARFLPDGSVEVLNTGTRAYIDAGARIAVVRGSQAARGTSRPALAVLAPAKAAKAAVPAKVAAHKARS